jgi:hypothetical protein
MLVAVGEKTSKARARLKYTGLIPHDLRRSAAKRLRTIGVPESVVMAMGGWKTAATFRLYVIVDTADQRQGSEKLEMACVEEERQDVPKSTLTRSEPRAESKGVSQKLQ